MSRIRADKLVNRAGTGAPELPFGLNAPGGLNVTGIVTATSYRGDGSQLTGIDASSLKDGSNTKVQATATGANVTGNVAATGNVTAVDGTFSGNAIVQGNLTVNGTTTTIDTAVTAVDSLAVDGNITAGGDVNIADKIAHTSDTNTAIRFPAADTFTVETAGSEALRVDSSQRLLLGTSTSQTIGTGSGGAQLQAVAANPVSFGRFSDDLYGCVVVIGKSRGAAAGSYTVVSNNDAIGEIRFAGADGTDLSSLAAKIAAEVDGTPGSNDMPGRLVFSTTSDGAASPTERLRITSDGDILPGADNTQDLGSSAKRFANIYTGDLNLSNEGSANDVDGTWGNYTIQEGEDDLFLINKRTGKKYKFNLTEVD